MRTRPRSTPPLLDRLAVWFALVVVPVGAHLAAPARLAGLA